MTRRKFFKATAAAGVVAATGASVARQAVILEVCWTPVTPGQVYALLCEELGMQRLLAQWEASATPEDRARFDRNVAAIKAEIVRQGIVRRALAQS